jgi:hypothetical protein
MYYKLPIKERMDLMKSYKKANKNMSYSDMVNDYNTSYQRFDNGGKKNTNVAESTFVKSPHIINLSKDTKVIDPDKNTLNHMYALQLLKKHNVDVDSTGNVLNSLGLNSAAYYNPITRTINYKHDPNKNPKTEYSEMVMKELPHAIQSDSIGVVPFLKNTFTEGAQDYLFEKDPNARYYNTSKIEGHAHNTLEQKLYDERQAKLYNAKDLKYGGIQRFDNGGIKKEVRSTTDNTNVAKPYFPNPDNTNMDPRKIPQSGMVVDKRTNQAYYFGDDGDTGTFPVLTAKNPEANKNTYSLSQLTKNSNLRSTPKGYYMVEKESKYKSKDDMQHYKGLMRSLNPIEAYGESKPRASDLALHLTFTDPGNPKVFKNREHLYNQTPQKRYASYGCVNCQESSYRAFNKAVPESDTLMMLDSKDPKDLRLLKQAQGRIKTKIKD